MNLGKNYKLNNIKIYPILILQDNLYNSIGLNQLINKWFSIELEKLEVEGLSILNVRPITVIVIDNLIFNMEVYKNEVVKMDDVIDSYHAFVKVDKSKQFNNGADAVNYRNKTFIPFSIYFSEHLPENYIPVLPDIISEKIASIC